MEEENFRRNFPGRINGSKSTVFVNIMINDVNFNIDNINSGFNEP